MLQFKVKQQTFLTRLTKFSPENNKLGLHWWNLKKLNHHKRDETNLLYKKEHNNNCLLWASFVS